MFYNSDRQHSTNTNVVSHVSLDGTYKYTQRCSQNCYISQLIRPINPVVIEFFKMMQKDNYIQDFTVIDDRRGRINNCAVISPRFDVSASELEQWSNRLLPSRLFGHVILTTSDGIMDHREAQRKNVGGKIIGFYY